MVRQILRLRYRPDACPRIPLSGVWDSWDSVAWQPVRMIKIYPAQNSAPSKTRYPTPVIASAAKQSRANYARTANLTRCLRLLAFLLLSATPTLAGGSLSLDEVQTIARQNPQLASEITAALRSEKITTPVTCTGARFGNHWTHLGGARTLPFECEIGRKKLTIEGTIDFLDEHNVPIQGGIENPNVFRQARHVRERNLTWRWE